jgi:hypothetical protein
VPPRSQFSISHRPLARDLRRELLVTPARIRELAALPPDDAAAIIAAELRFHCDFATRLADFLTDEVLSVPLAPWEMVAVDE